MWLSRRFCLSFRVVEDLLAQRGITASYEAIRHWCRTFGPTYARTLRRQRGRMGDTWHLDEVFESLLGRLVAGQVRGEELDGDLALQARVLGRVDDPHAAVARWLCSSRDHARDPAAIR